jgi:membrane protein implicated in regulation of membrane protease activity
MYSWLILFVVLIILELCTVNLTTIWFAFGALIAYVVSLFTNNITIQTTVFLAVSVITLILTRPIVKKYLLTKPSRTNADMLIGKIGIVTKEITKTDIGEVKIDGKYWSAKANKKIKEGSKVEILAIEGVKLIVLEKEDDD